MDLMILVLFIVGVICSSLLSFIAVAVHIIKHHTEEEKMDLCGKCISFDSINQREGSGMCIFSGYVTDRHKGCKHFMRAKTRLWRKRPSDKIICKKKEN